MSDDLLSIRRNAGDEFGGIPDELKALRQWVCYRIEERDGEPTKVPYNPNGRAHARSNDAKTWSTFEAAVKMYRNPAGRFDGIGFMLSADDPFVFLDFDDVISDGTLEPWARDMVERLDSFTEYSRSGSGLHVIVRAKKPGERCRAPKTLPKFEVYEERRLCVFTGRVFEGRSHIREAQEAVTAIYYEVFGLGDSMPVKETAKNAVPVGMSDPGIIKKAMEAKNGARFRQLWHGDTGDFNGDESAADMALCDMLAFWTGRDAERMDRLFRESGLMRPKWDSMRGGETYGQRTIRKAVESASEVYTPRAKKGKTKQGGSVDAVSGSALPGSAPDGYPLTDLGNAERLVAKHGDNLRFNVEAGQWLTWDGRRWASDSTGQVHRLAREVVRGLYSLLPDCEGDARDALFKHAKSSESRQKLEAMVKLAQHCPGIPVQASDLDSDAWLFNCQNGTLDLRTGTLQEHRQSDLLTKLSPVAYDAAAKAERWERFLREVFCEDEELIGFTRRMAGYALTGDTREQCFFLFTGKGSNGKSKLTEALAYVLGDYSKDTPVTTFLERRGESSCDLASLVGARLVTASEGEGTTSFSESLLKGVTGGDPLTARHLYQEQFTYMPTFKVFFATNEVPRMRSQNYAMRRRVKLLPFKQRFYYAHEQKAPVRDEALGEKLRAEASGILAWMMRGCLEWRRDGLGMPGAMQAEVDSLFEGMDVLLDFIEAECELHPRLEVETGELWRAYLEWCERTKTKQAFKRASDFSRNLCGRDSVESKRTKHARLLSGIGLRGRGDPPPAVTTGDAKTPFSETPLREAHIEKVPENTQMASPGVTREREQACSDGSGGSETGEEVPPGACRNCGGILWRREPVTAMKPEGAWVCRTCSHAHVTGDGSGLEVRL